MIQNKKILQHRYNIFLAAPSRARDGFLFRCMVAGKHAQFTVLLTHLFNFKVRCYELNKMQHHNRHVLYYFIHIICIYVMLYCLI